VVLALGACGTAGVTLDGPEGGATVSAVGDSLTDGAADRIVDRLRGGGDRVGGEWEHGRTTARAVDVLGSGGSRWCRGGGDRRR
jgi:hypothetical protein